MLTASVHVLCVCLPCLAHAFVHAPRYVVVRFGGTELIPAGSRGMNPLEANEDRIPIEDQLNPAELEFVVDRHVNAVFAMRKSSLWRRDTALVEPESVSMMQWNDGGCALVQDGTFQRRSQPAFIGETPMSEVWFDLLLSQFCDNSSGKQVSLLTRAELVQGFADAWVPHDSTKSTTDSSGVTDQILPGVFGEHSSYVSRWINGRQSFVAVFSPISNREDEHRFRFRGLLLGDDSVYTSRQGTVSISYSDAVAPWIPAMQDAALTAPLEGEATNQLARQEVTNFRWSRHLAFSISAIAVAVFCFFVVAFPAEDYVMRIYLIGAFLLLLVVPCIALQGLAVVPSSNLAVNPVGQWTINSCELYGVPSTASVDSVIEFMSDGTGTISRDGKIAEFSFAMGVSHDGILHFEITEREDQFVHGGGGPRQGILRILESGELEVIEGACAGAQPTDFSQASKSTEEFYVCSRIAN